MIYENTIFRVRRITSELVVLTYQNRGEPLLIGITSDESGNRFTFWSEETGIED
ncbi:MAG: hypothetical protein JW815_05455 [Candidatus Bathyarchaeota archaeon]|nr:hypothetical protein [Candidatus Bathyarchaeum sp.]